ncbi:non-specific serine/threonine protein kinase [Entamoeba marina]
MATDQQQLLSQAAPAHQSTTSDLPKTVTVDSFKKIKLIGKGDVGRVYLVQLIGTNHYFAMKVLIKQQMVSRNKIKRVSTERDILLTTRHPFIVHLYWSFSTATCFYFIMDYCAGGDFYNLLSTVPHKCLQEETVKFYLAEVLLALEYLHLNGIIYRDLKPENILFHQSGHVMLSDFDLSKTQPGQQSGQSFQQLVLNEKSKIKSEPTYCTNSFVGTEEYLAPEVITGYGHSGTVDWWTFGILMYEMLFGKTPFISRCREQTFSLILDGEIQFPKHHRYPVSASAKDLIKKLLVNDPSKRLGAKKGASEIKSHKFFKSIKFQLIRNSQPPIIPQLNDPEDTSNFKNIQDDDEIKQLEAQALELEHQTIPSPIN